MGVKVEAREGYVFELDDNAGIVFYGRVYTF